MILGPAKSCKLVTEQIIVLGLDEVGGHLILAWPMSLPLLSGSCYLAMGLPCLRKVASACSSVWMEKPEAFPSSVCGREGWSVRVLLILQEQVRQRPSLVKQGEILLARCGLELRVGKIGVIEDCAVPSDRCQEVMIRVSWVCCTV